LVEVGYDRASTNLIARVAGVSVGSLYQYFPSKEALVLAVARRHEQSMVALLAEMASELMHAPVALGVRAYIRATLRAHALEPELHRVLREQASHLAPESVLQIDREARSIVRRYLEAHRSQILPDDLEIAAFLLVTTVDALTCKALTEDPARLADPAFVDEVGTLVLRYLTGHTPVDTEAMKS
jgi:AcrR family transcriptional regulator